MLEATNTQKKKSKRQHQHLQTTFTNDGGNILICLLIYFKQKKNFMLRILADDYLHTFTFLQLKNIKNKQIDTLDSSFVVNKLYL